MIDLSPGLLVNILIGIVALSLVGFSFQQTWKLVVHYRQVKARHKHDAEAAAQAPPDHPADSPNPK